MKRVIYETRGRAKEFCPLAINLYSGCRHGCTYCYAPTVIKRQRQDFQNIVAPRVTEDDLKRSAAHWKRKCSEAYYPDDDVLLCFTCDPYQPLETAQGLTRRAIEILHEFDLKVTILTKAGYLPRRDFDILSQFDTFATTLTCVSEEESIKWEPGAALPEVRIENLRIASNRGINTWASLEPVIHPDWAIAMIWRAYRYVDHFKIGTMNYADPAVPINWEAFGEQAIKDCIQAGVRYYIKKDLARHLGRTEGFWGGPDVD